MLLFYYHVPLYKGVVLGTGDTVVLFCCVLSCCFCMVCILENETYHKQTISGGNRILKIMRNRIDRVWELYYFTYTGKV